MCEGPIRRKLTVNTRMSDVLQLVRLAEVTQTFNVLYPGLNEDVTRTEADVSQTYLDVTHAFLVVSSVHGKKKPPKTLNLPPSEVNI